VAKKKRTGTTSQKKSARRKKEALTNVRNRPLRDLTEEALKKYLKDLNGDKPAPLYGLILGEIEHPLFKTVMDHTEGNQSQAAEILGITRATLRKKLRHYSLLS
jgi:Fis family transcriptional regulator